MKFVNYLILSFLICFLVGCKEQPKIEKLAVESTLIKAIISPTGNNSSLPFLFSNGSKTLLSWVEKEGDSLTKFKYAFYTEKGFGAPQNILQGTDWFVNWADFPMVAENRGNLWSHVLKKSTSGTYSYDVKMNVKAKDSTNWQTDLALYTDNTPTEHGFVTVLPYKDAFFVTWLDGRNTQENEAGERGAMTVRAAVVGADGTVTKSTELDARTCDCCQTSAAITANGPIVVYRDRSAEELRDIYIVREVKGEWSAPKAVYNDNWEIKGCPVNGPKAAAIENTVVVAWYTEAHKMPTVQLAFSADAGENFDMPIPVATDKSLGRVDAFLIDTETAIVSWMETKDATAVLKAVKVSRNGTVSKPLEITELDASRKTGFPQMERVGEQVLFAWTAISSPEKSIKTVLVALDQF